MFGMFKRKANNVKADLKKLENRDLMEAIVGGCLLVAYADGECEPEELASLEALIMSNPSIQHFGTEINSTITRFRSQLEANFNVGKLYIKREIADVKNTQRDAEEVLVNVIAIAAADGEVEPAEAAIIKELASSFGLRAADYGFEG